MGRYDKEYEDTAVADAIISVATCGLSTALGAKTGHKCTITDTETGDEATGWGDSRTEAGQNAWEELKKDEGGCFLTTACVSYLGLDDNCDELQTLRIFRDNYVRSLENGSEMIDEYYRIAPQIVTRIEASEQREVILSWIYTQIEVAIWQIKCGKYAEALATYRNMFLSLQSF